MSLSSRKAFHRQRMGKRDANHKAIADGLRALGHFVIDLAGAGNGIADLCVYPRANPMPHWCKPGEPVSMEKVRWHSEEPVWLEVKTAKGSLLASQRDWRAAAESRGVRVAVVRSLDEAVSAVMGPGRAFGAETGQEAGK